MPHNSPVRPFSCSPDGFQNLHSTGPAIGQINPQWSAMLLAHVRNAKIFSTIITLPHYKYDKKNRSISQATRRETALRRIRSGGKKTSLGHRQTRLAKPLLRVHETGIQAV
ncbi:hypothetical protein [Xanthomonas translucens]|uniref:hypothetical protein n=1 Tax=Xanthomonas campestris pv. translucens TaxID=343 RepID=UPI001E3EE98A|nr:hypothetical protein [Xanthomonas translucens]UJB13780.1 hypothetical protein LTC53_12130 [Xanthomonas translucens pv. undulosa]WKZ99668.1 hypothetical protein MO330_12285 [Xanthomonas translucens]WLA03453.1 hypothetical protein MO329_12225 [Xanthomonas translucens]WLA07195.1 hypothetical protein MO328_12160 [Xanthomonas translucens]WLA17986.1 hypothetical protein MO326_07970 [Xanthomonas translucens]